MDRISQPHGKANMALLIVVLFITACSSAQAKIIPSSTVLVQPTEKIEPTNTSSPRPTATTTPGTALTTYLLSQADLPNCEETWLEETNRYSFLYCNMKGGLFFGEAIFAFDQPYNKSAMDLYGDYVKTDVAQIGDATVLGVRPNGNEAQLQYVRGNWRVVTDMSNPEGKINIDDLVAYTQRADKRIPAEAPFPAALPFPENENKGKQQDYFSDVKMTVVNSVNNRVIPLKVSDELPEYATICITVAPVIKSRDYWTVALYNVQKQQIIKKLAYEMYEQGKCGGFDPDYDQGQFKAGDKYELRVAVGDDWVATFPFVTK